MRKKGLLCNVIAASAMLCILDGSARAAEVTVGLIGELTGAIADYGKQVARGSQLAAEWLNAQGNMSGNTIKLLVEDDGSDKAQALTLLNRFALRDNASVVIGPSASPLSLAIAPRAEELAVPMITIAYSGAVVENRSWVFKSTDITANQFKAIGAYTADVLKPKACARVWVRDNDAYVQTIKAWSEAVQPKGVKLVDDTSVLLADTDFSAASTKIVSLQPDCVYLALSPEGSANFILQLKSAGLPSTTKVIGGTTMSTRSFLNAAGKAADGTFSLAEYTPGGVNDLGRQFESAYKAKFGERPDTFAALGFSQMLIVATALKQAGANPTREAIRDAFGKIRDMDTVVGRGKLSLVDRIAHYDMTILTVKGGELVPAPQQ